MKQKTILFNSKMIVLLIGSLLIATGVTHTTEPTTSMGEYRDGIEYGLVAIQGQRPTMEDAHTIRIPAQGQDPGSGLFAVFDGHGGTNAANYAARSLPSFFELKWQEIENRQPDPSKHSDPSIDFSVCEEPIGDQALRESFLAIDNVIRQKEIPSGTTAIAAYLSPPSNQCPPTVIIANTGDSRGIICNVDGQVIEETKEHKATTNLMEKKRIIDAGAQIWSDTGQIYAGTPYSSAFLQPTRTLGDIQLKAKFKEYAGKNKDVVIPKPEIYSNILPQERFIILACDDLWDKVTSKEAAEIVARYLRMDQHEAKKELEKATPNLGRGALDVTTKIDPSNRSHLAAAALVAEAENRGQKRGNDNISVLVFRSVALSSEEQARLEMIANDLFIQAHRIHEEIVQKLEKEAQKQEEGLELLKNRIASLEGEAAKLEKEAKGWSLYAPDEKKLEEAGELKEQATATKDLLVDAERLVVEARCHTTSIGFDALAATALADEIAAATSKPINRAVRIASVEATRIADAMQKAAERAGPARRLVAWTSGADPRNDARKEFAFREAECIVATAGKQMDITLPESIVSEVKNKFEAAASIQTGSGEQQITKNKHQRIGAIQDALMIAANAVAEERTPQLVAEARESATSHAPLEKPALMEGEFYTEE